jgi:hypothetical protein
MATASTLALTPSLESLAVIQFSFSSNKSFCFASGHPITVPKGQVSYDALEAVVGSARKGHIRFPDGSHVPAILYHSTAGFGPYYQIRARGRSGQVLNNVDFLLGGGSYAARVMTSA